MILIICQALEDIPKGIEFERGEASFCESHGLDRQRKAESRYSMGTYQLVAQLLS